MVMTDTAGKPATERPAVKSLLAALLLALILGFGGALRFVGQNWDDFSHTHPDELFLTLLVLPNIGGANSYTDDHDSFPPLQVLVRRDSGIALSGDDLLHASGFRLGGLRGSSARHAIATIAQGEASFYANSYEAIRALQTGAIDILLLHEAQPADESEIQRVDQLSTRDLQRLFCKRLYPDSDGSGGFFDARCSPLNPHNAGYSFYVYGTFPLLLAHFGGEFVQNATQAGLPLFDYQAGHLVWRGISMIFDILSIVVVFGLGARLHNRWVGLLAALFYAAAPLAIQKAHFGTVNATAAFFVMLALYFAVRAQQRGKLRLYLMFGLACGTAVACRINLAPLAGIIVVAALYQCAPAFDSRLNRHESLAILRYHCFGLVLAGLGAFLAFRVFNPYAFVGPGFFGLLPNARWLENLAEASRGVGGHSDSPPNWQWLARSPLVYVSKDLLFWGMGLAFGALAWTGFAWSGLRLLRNRKRGCDNLLLVLWVGLYMLWMSRLWTMTMRYYLPLYGALAVLAGWCLYALYHHRREHGRGPPLASLLALFFALLLGGVGLYRIAIGQADATAISALVLGIGLLAVAVSPRLEALRPQLLGAFAVAFSCLWALMHSNIYQHQTTLVQSSRYIFERVPSNFAMAIDGADESVPLMNIAFDNTGLSSPEYQGEPFRQTTQFKENAPARVGFKAPASGPVSRVFAPHLADMQADAEPEKLRIRVYRASDSSPLAEATLEANLAPVEHPLGEAYTIPFERSWLAEAGLNYEFEVMAAAGAGDVVSSGSVVLNEGNWDNRATGINICPLPGGLTLADDPPSGMVGARDCRGTQAFFKLVNAQDQIMSFPVDNQVKYDDILRALELGDYLTIASNRFYDSETRNPQRWPLTTLYYEKLFAEELGYELIAVFEETFELGPWRVSDQRLPHYDSPAWLNELEADEAFHVYDHPAVFIFKKSPSYSRARVQAALSPASLKQAHELQPGADRAQLLGVFYWSSVEADPAPTALTFTPAEYERQSAGGTWSERFFSDGLVNRNQAAGVALWYFTIFAIGLLAFPLVFALFPAMADGGYGFAKLVGMLLVAWLAWALSSLKIPLWSQAGIALCLALLALCSLILGIRNRARLGAFLRARWRRLALMEMLALAAFLAMILVRLTNPDLWHPYKGGEKPMDFAYLNGVLRSTTFPPIDPWFAGGFINYYYFGYVLLGAPTLLLGIVPAFAYNLMIPSLFSLTGMGAFSAAFNILARWRLGLERGRKHAATTVRALGNPWVAGLMALALCVALGNLDTVRVFGTGLARLGGYHQPAGLEQFLLEERLAEVDAIAAEEGAAIARRASERHPLDSLRYELDHSLELAGSLIHGLGKALSGETLPIGSDRWYWGPSRVLAETPGVGGGAITEMPYFTFLYGDLHAHMISMPLILLGALFLFNELAVASQDERRNLERFLALALGALTIGILRATNTWDWPSMTLFAGVGLAYIWLLRWKHSFRPVHDPRFHLALLAFFGGGAILCSLLLPAFGGPGMAANTVSPRAAAEVARALLLAGGATVLLIMSLRFWLGRASALDLLGRLGGFLLLNVAFALPYSSWYAATYNSLRLWDGGKTPLWAYFDIHGLFLFLTVSLLCWETAHWLRQARVDQLLRNWRRLRWFGLLLALLLLLSLALTLSGYQVALVALPLIAWIALLFFRPGQSRALRFVLALIGLALSMTLGVEIVVLGGDIGRQNTVFKFYMQVWLLLSVAGGVAFACLLRASRDFNPRLQLLWRAPCLLLFFAAALFPLMATRGRSFDRMAPDLPLTLNGLDYMTRATHYAHSPEKGESAALDLAVDHQLIRWLQENARGSPVIIEGRRRPSEYQWNGRVSISTGLPSVLGWNFHQRQQRTLGQMSRWVDQRERNILQFYDSADIDVAVDILNHYDIRYIIVGGLERLQASAEGIAKFERMAERGLLRLAFSVDGGSIYEVDKAALFEYLVERYR